MASGRSARSILREMPDREVQEHRRTKELEGGSGVRGVPRRKCIVFAVIIEKDT